MHEKSQRVWFTVDLTWQRMLAGLCVALALGLLVYGFVIRPTVSTYVGRQVSERISEEIAEELSQAVVAGILAPPSPGAPGASAEQPAPGAASAAQPPLAVAEQAATPGALGAPLSQPAALPGQQPAGASQAPAQAIASAVAAQLQPSAQPDAAGKQTAGAGLTSPPAADAGAGEQAGAAPMPTSAGEQAGAAPPSERTLEQVVEALPTGVITVTEQKLNEKIAPRVAGMGPIENVEVHFVPGMIQVTLAVFGRDNLATAGLTVANNQVVVRNPQLEGPLGLLVSAEALIGPIEEELNKTLDLAGREVRAVTIEQGQIVVTLN